MSDTRLDIERDKYLEWKEQQREAKRNACEQCSEHNENCVYYDPEEEAFDYEECFRDSGGWE
jgi:hypothetical protein